MARSILHHSHQQPHRLGQRDVLARVSHDRSGLQSRPLEGHYRSAGPLVPTDPPGHAQICDRRGLATTHFSPPRRRDDRNVAFGRDPWKLSTSYGLGTAGECGGKDVRSCSDQRECAFWEAMFYFTDAHLDVSSGQDIVSGSVNFKRGTKPPTAILLQSKNSLGILAAPSTSS